MSNKEREEMERIKAEAEKLKAETKAIHHGIWLKWYTALITTAIGSTTLLKIIKELVK